MLDDLKYALRMLRKSPGVTVAAVLALALGIGANSAIFSVVNSVLLKPLAYKDSGRLVWTWETEPDLPLAPLTSPDYQEWRDRNRSFEQLEAYTIAGFNLTGRERPVLLTGSQVTPGFLRMLGVKPALGRDFMPEEGQPGKDNVVMLSHGAWMKLFGSDPKVVGRTLMMDGVRRTVIGVLPREFRQFPGGDAWVPFVLRPADERGTHFMWGIGKLKPGVTIQQAQAEIETIARSLEKAYPDSNTGIGAHLIPLQEQFVGRIRPTLVALFGAVGFVLLIACGNVANLLLARAAARRKEMAVRTALGGSRARLVRQMLTESTVLAAAGGALGVLLAHWGIKALKLAQGANIPRLAEVALDGRAVLFTAGISLATGILFGIAPALRLARVDLSSTMKDAHVGSAAAFGRHGPVRLGGILVVLEIALSLVLATGCGLMVKSFLRLVNLDLGFRPDNVLTARLWLPDARYQGAAKNQLFERLVERVRTLPGVRNVGVVSKLPVMGGNNGTVIVEGRPIPKGDMEGPLVENSAVSHDYFRAMGIALASGRLLEPADDRPDARRVAVINEEMARRFWPGENPVGKRYSRSKQQPDWIEVVGVVANVRQHGLERVAIPETYVPFGMQADRGLRYVVLRTASDPARYANAVAGELRALDRDLPLSQVLTMNEVIEQQSSSRRFHTMLFVCFAALALILAAIGIYGVLSYSVTQRNREIGIRMALGAEMANVLGMVLRQAMVLVVAGFLLGVAGSLALSHTISTLLFDVKATDPGAYAAVIAVLAGVSALAALAPARRAAKTDPLVVLRYE
jgi:putative ABC transport system permease protein